MSEAGPRDRAVAAFADHFGTSHEWLIRSPGRVNLIGDHTDYSEGFVLPIAIDRGIWLAARPRPDRVVRLWSELGSAWTEFDADRPSRRSGWAAYVEGVASVLAETGHELGGFEGVLTSDLPAGAGLSSSAALELVAARAFTTVAGSPWQPVPMALAAQRAENEWVGMNCGIMDQLICATGVAGHAMLIDCRSLQATPVPLPETAAVVVLDTMTRRQLVDSEYNDRRESCERVAGVFGMEVLRDLDRATLDAGRDLIDGTDYRRARHVLNENKATLAAAQALTAGDLSAAGMLMNSSHASLRDDFEVTTPALDAMAAAARTTHGCYGARMTGAGFGGSVVALVAASHVEAFAEEVLAAYEEQTGDQGTAMSVIPSDGVSLAP